MVQKAEYTTNVVLIFCFMVYKWYKYIIKDAIVFIRGDYKSFYYKKLRINNIYTLRGQKLKDKVSITVFLRPVYGSARILL